MKTNLKLILAVVGVFASLASSAMAQSVTSIRAVPTAGNNHFQNLGHGLQIATICHDGGEVKIILQNIGTGFVTLNWLYSDGTAVNASGVVVRPGYEFDFRFLGKRIEGQFIFANSAGNTTVSLHAFDGGTFCETQGTAQFGPN